MDVRSRLATLVMLMGWMVLLAGFGVAQSSSLSHDGEAFTVTILVQMDEAAMNADAIWLGGVGPHLRWAQDRSSWFPQWELQLAAEPGILPPSKVDDFDGTVEFIRLSPQVTGGRPQDGRFYETVVSYDPIQKQLAYSLRDVTSGEEITAAHMEGVSAQEIEYPQGSDMRDAVQQLNEAYGHVAEVGIEYRYTRIGLPFEMTRDFSWELVEYVDDEPRRKTGFLFWTIDKPGVRVSWPDREMTGELRFTARRGDEREHLLTVSWSQEPQAFVIPFDRLPRGDSTLEVDYMDESYESPVAVARGPIRVIAGEIALGIQEIARIPGGLSGSVMLSSARTLPDYPFRLFARFVPGGESNEKHVERLILDQSVDMPENRRVMIPFEISLPPDGGKILFRFESDMPEFHPTGGTEREFTIHEVPPVHVNLSHATMAVEIGEPAVIRPGQAYPTLRVYSYPRGELSGEIVHEDGTWVAEIPVQEVAERNEVTVEIPGQPRAEGLYEIRLRLKSDGLPDHADTFYFTVHDPDALPPHSSRIVYVGDDGRLVYVPDFRGTRIPDFSYAGYHYGERDLPDVPVVATLGPSNGDDTQRIQAALNEIGARAPDANGLRGTLVLEPGVYEIWGTLHIRHGGIVLRGTGDGTDPTTDTILFARGNTPHQRTVVMLGSGSTNPWAVGAPVDITDSFVPVNASSFHVADPTAFSVDQEVMVRHPSTQAWIDALGGGGVVSSVPWSVGSMDLQWVRRITEVDGSRLYLDAPIYNHLDRSLTQATVAPVTRRNLISESGIENLRVDIETAGGEDENHAWNAISVIGADNSWVRNVSTRYFGYAGVRTQGSIRITIKNVSATDPVAIRTGARMYNLATDHYSQLILFTGCHAGQGRHSFVSNGTTTVSGVVWHRCTMEGGGTEGHRRWSQGMLFDSIQEIGSANSQAKLINRGDFGSSHGWGSAHSVIWDFNREIVVQKPPTAQNYAISTGGWLRSSPWFPGPWGHLEIGLEKLEPESLYEAQLSDRLGRKSD